ncbi:MAG: ATP:cob(I)alamin adenosyltransferase [Anaerorhabdus sp.]
MRIVTKQGDFGMTDVSFGKVSKHHPLIEVLGQLDQLIAEVTLLAAEFFSFQEDSKIIIDDCSQICAILSGYQPNYNFKNKIVWLEDTITSLSSDLQFQFVYPLDNLCAAKLNRVRTLVRSAERCCWRLHEEIPVDSDILIYINRLSDFWYCQCCKEIERTGKDHV